MARLCEMKRYLLKQAIVSVFQIFPSTCPTASGVQITPLMIFDWVIFQLTILPRGVMLYFLLSVIESTLKLQKSLPYLDHRDIQCNKMNMFQMFQIF